MERGVVFNIQRGAVHDGPGIRTLVFLKGCPLRCFWCCNPESQAPQPEPVFDVSLCLGPQVCGRCLAVCPHGAMAVTAAGTLGLDRTQCGPCGLHCAKVCPARAMTVSGKVMTVDEVLAVVEEDAVFYRHSGGGLTLSGGEPLAQGAFALDLVREASNRGLHTVLETSGMAAWSDLAAVLPWLDGLIYDLKHPDAVCHRQATGSGNETICEQLFRLLPLMEGKAVRVRTPVIPGFSDSPETVAAIAGLLRPYPSVQYELMPYHRFGEAKYARLGRAAPRIDHGPSVERLNELTCVAKSVLGARVVEARAASPMQNCCCTGEKG